MAGRKPIYRPETLEIGQKIALKGKNIKFAHQYIYAFRGRCPDMDFKFNGKEIERIK
jgi:hypothetical protein